MFDRCSFACEMERCSVDPLRALGRYASPHPGALWGLNRAIVHRKVLPHLRKLLCVAFAQCSSLHSLLLRMLIGLWDFSRLHLEGIMGYDYNFLTRSSHRIVIECTQGAQHKRICGNHLIGSLA